jgi:hypothetical protein
LAFKKKLKIFAAGGGGGRKSGGGRPTGAAQASAPNARKIFPQ